MSDKSDLASLNKRCERSINKMLDAEAFDYIGELIDDSHDASFGRGATRALYLLEELKKRLLAEKDAVLAEYFRANAWRWRRAQIPRKRWIKFTSNS